MILLRHLFHLSFKLYFPIQTLILRLDHLCHVRQKKPPWLWPHFEKRCPHCRSFAAVETDYIVWTIYKLNDLETAVGLVLIESCQFLRLRKIFSDLGAGTLACFLRAHFQLLKFSAITNSHIFPDEGSIAETSEFYLQLSAFNLPPSHF